MVVRNGSFSFIPCQQISLYQLFCSILKALIRTYGEKWIKMPAARFHDTIWYYSVWYMIYIYILCVIIKRNWIICLYDSFAGDEAILNLWTINPRSNVLYVSSLFLMILLYVCIYIYNIYTQLYTYTCMFTGFGIDRLSWIYVAATIQDLPCAWSGVQVGHVTTRKCPDSAYRSFTTLPSAGTGKEATTTFMARVVPRHKVLLHFEVIIV